MSSRCSIVSVVIGGRIIITDGIADIIRVGYRCITSCSSCFGTVEQLSSYGTYKIFNELIYNALLVLMILIKLQAIMISTY